MIRNLRLDRETRVDEMNARKLRSPLIIMASLFAKPRDTDTRLEGLGVNSVSIDIDATKTGFAGALDWQYVGGLVFFKLNF